MKYEGQITLDNSTGSKKFLLDAEPHIMARLRKIFENSKNTWSRGKYTHKPILFPVTLSASRDLLWVKERYRLEVDPLVDNIILEKAEEYDNIAKKLDQADSNSNYIPSKEAFKLTLPLREHQVKALNMLKQVNRMLLADRMGLGKTASGIAALLEPESRPALVVVPSHLCTQWENEIKRFIPQATTHVIRGFKNYALPKVDVIITSYNRLSPWQDVLISDDVKFNTLVLDEVHEVRHPTTSKRHMAYELSKTVKTCLGLSGTPIYNNGNEIWSVIDVIKPESLGEYSDFDSEWCINGKVNEPSTLNNYLKTQGLMLRRTPEDIGLKFGQASKHIYTLDADMDKLHEIQNVAKLLALSVLSGNVREDSTSAREFDMKMRHATGVAKARPVAEFVKMLAEQGEKVLLASWHRDVYDIYLKELAALKPVMYTGSESPKDKEKAVKSFIEGDSQVFIISLRSGSGLDGLQKQCNTVVFGELDWSPHVMDQVVARLDRDGQTKHVNAYYLTIADGADPHMVGVLGGKRSQHDGLVEGKTSDDEVLAVQQNNDRIKTMAADYLKSIGEEVPEIVHETGLLGEAAQFIRQLKLLTNTEAEMQESLNKYLVSGLNKDVLIEREYKISKRSRVDFMLSRGNEKIAVECKIEYGDRAAVYRQVRRYVEESQITALLLVAPWFGIASFKIDGTPVIVVDTNINAI